jgi:hypothetical protein
MKKHGLIAGFALAAAGIAGMALSNSRNAPYMGENLGMGNKDYGVEMKVVAIHGHTLDVRFHTKENGVDKVFNQNINANTDLEAIETMDDMGTAIMKNMDTASMPSSPFEFKIQ